MIKLTDHAVWTVYAGGTFSGRDRHSYEAYTTIGRYMIDPVSSPLNAESHIGYRAMFVNENGKLPGVLYQPLNKVTTLTTARRLCQEHMAANGGEIIRDRSPKAITRDELRKSLKEIGMTLRVTEHGEYRVNFLGGAESTAYYTDDAQDALGTARLMAKEKNLA